MSRQLKEQLKMLACLLQYPEPQWLAELAENRDRIEASFSGSDSVSIRRLIDHLLSAPLLSSQEAYAAAFDLNAATCLNLSYHRFGDAKERGAQLARFAAAYQERGFEPVIPELPDYLPMVLELIAHSPDQECQWMLLEYSPSLNLLAERLHTMHSRYADLFKILSRMLQSSADQAKGGLHG